MNDCLYIVFCQHLLCTLSRADLCLSLLLRNHFAYLHKNTSPTFPQIKNMGRGEERKENTTVASNAYFIIMISKAFFITLGATKIFYNF